MKLRYIFILQILVFFSTFTGISQPTETTYLGSVAKSGSDNNSIYGPFNIGFNFTFFGNSYTEFFIGTNGLISFVEGYDYPENYTIPDATVLLDAEGVPIVPNIPNNYIAPFWDDLTIDASGNILYATVGASPNRKLIVQFRNMGFYGGPVYMGTFYVILYETTGVIQTQYRILVLESATKPHGESATIGLENIDGTIGALYSFNSSTAISSRQAISYSPSAGNYTINSNAVYDGVYLTKNLTLPEPGITALLSPAENGTIGTSHTFQWSPSSNAASYSLKISTNSSLSGAVSYNAGSDLSYSLSGLIPGTTYYWGVFATNATGTTWGEVKKFSVSSAPPLAAVPQTVWTEQGLDKTIKLNYSGGDESPKAAVIASIPSQGQLYQYIAGIRGSLISSAPTTVSDAGMNVIYAASGSSGNGVGNFNFKVNDGGGDSPEATITVNVSPPGIPNLLYVAKGTNSIEMQFDRQMTDPTGKQDEFTATVDGSTVVINTLSLKTGDDYSIIATLNTTLSGGETVLISYSAGTITSAVGGWLASFTNQAVTLLSQTIEFSQSLTKKYSDSPVTFTATAPGGSMTYSSSNLSIATVSGSAATLKAIGSTDITARQAGDASYAPAKYTRTMTVAKGDQIITFNALPAKTVGDADFPPGATTTSGLPITYVSYNTAVATIVSGNIHIVAAGAAVVNASQAGNTLWNAATSVSQTLTVSGVVVDKTLNLTSVLLEGLYSSGGNMRQAWNELGPLWPAGVADHITVELHSAANYSTIVYTVDDVPLSTVGTASVSIPVAYEDSYYITIRHHNSIETTTASPVSFAASSINHSFGAFTDVYGFNLKPSFDGYNLIFGGDVNQNGIVESFDMTPIDNLSSSFGYGFSEDINCDGLIDSRDMTIIDNNNSGFVSAILP